MRFVTVPITGGPTDGKAIRFCVWETRVRDFQEFVKATKSDWPKPDFAQGPDHPAVNLDWSDANAFCAWLTKEERRWDTSAERGASLASVSFWRLRAETSLSGPVRQLFWGNACGLPASGVMDALTPAWEIAKLGKHC